MKQLQLLLQQSKGFYQDDDGGFDQYEHDDFEDEFGDPKTSGEGSTET